MAVTLPSGFPTSPSAVRTTTDQSYVSSLDIHKEEIYSKLVEKFGVQSITQLIGAMGRMSPVAQREYSHYSETFLHQTFSFDAESATPTSGFAEVTVDIDAAYMDGNYTYIREKDIIQLSDGRQFLVTETSSTSGSSLNADQAKIKPYQAWSNATVVGVQAIVIGRTNLEGGTTPNQTLTPKVDKYTNNVMIIDDAYIYTGSEGTNQIWFDVVGEDGTVGRKWKLKGESDARLRFENYCEMLMIVGTNPSTAAGSLGADGYSNTRGLIPDIQANGQTLALGGSAITLADITAMIKSLDKYRGAKNNKLFAGFDLRTAIDDELAGINGHYSGGFNFGTFEDSASVKGLKLEFDRLRRGGYNIDLHTYDLFNDPNLLGAADFGYVGSGIMMPMDVGVDPKTRNKVPSLAVRYKELEGSSRYLEHWLTGGTDGVYTNDSDTVKCNYRTERGLEAFGLNRFFWISK